MHVALRADDLCVLLYTKQRMDIDSSERLRNVSDGTLSAQMCYSVRKRAERIPTAWRAKTSNERLRSAREGLSSKYAREVL